jgi:hypothetical protein
VAQVLANHGYLVMTFDVQGQGRSDTLGSGDSLFAGVPSQQTPVFTEGLVDALDFFDSAPSRPYSPRGAEGARRQREELGAGDASAYDPLHAALDRSRIGIVGHSLGAAAVSIVQETERRADALVAWDNLSAGGPPPAAAIKPRIPALGMSADYGLTPNPNLSDPDPTSKSSAFQAWKRAGVDAMEVVIRGGTHYEWSYISNPAFGASLRGMDAAAWYTTAWLDKYLKRDPTADARLLTNRWRADPIDRQVDPGGGGNLFSFYYRSPVAIHATRGGRALTCPDLRAGCSGVVAADGLRRDPPYSFLNDR